MKVSRHIQYAVISAEHSPSIHVHFISKSDIKALNLFLNARWGNMLYLKCTATLQMSSGIHRASFIYRIKVVPLPCFFQQQDSST